MKCFSHTPSLYLALLLAAFFTTAQAEPFDIEHFRQLDPNELRQAEDRMDEYLEPGTARLLRQPRNAAERYVVARQTRLAEQITASPQSRQLHDGTEVVKSFWPAARATRVHVDEHGRVQLECIPAIERLGRTLPDFRHPESAPDQGMVK
jgi:hypothetical protein